MKKIVAFFIVLTAGIMSFSQTPQAELHYEGQPVGPAFTIDSTNLSLSFFTAYYYVVNTGTVDIDLSFKRVRNYHTNGWTDQICDCLICFNTTNTTEWIRPAVPAVTIAPGDSCVFQPKVYPNSNGGCSIYTYFIEGQNKTFLDSVQVTYKFNGANCFLSQNELSSDDFKFSVFPNPVNDVLNVNVENLTGKANVTIYDIVGNEVLNTNLINGKNTLNVESLTAGIYFYTIRKENAIIETKKIVVQ